MNGPSASGPSTPPVITMSPFGASTRSFTQAGPSHAIEVLAVPSGSSSPKKMLRSFALGGPSAPGSGSIWSVPAITISPVGRTATANEVGLPVIWCAHSSEPAASSLTTKPSKTFDDMAWRCAPPIVRLPPKRPTNTALPSPMTARSRISE
ncbi:MAG: hypothetical protein QM820_60980 [Minicystis sp.]